MNIIRPNQTNSGENSADSSTTDNFTPLPHHMRSAADHKGKFWLSVNLVKITLKIIAGSVIASLPPGDDAGAG